MNSIVVHYQEIALKGKNRPWFLGRLVRNLRGAVSDLDVHGGARADGADRDRARSGRDARGGRRTDPPHLRHRQLLVRGPHAARPRGPDRRDPRATSTPRTLRQLPRVGAARRQAISADVAAGRAGDRRPHQGRARLESRPRACRARRARRAAVRPRRSTSSARSAARAGCRRAPPDASSCLLSGGIDSPVAAYRMMKRGCAVTFVHFHSYPILSRASQEKARELVALLTRGSSARGCTSCRSARSSSRSCSRVPGPMRVVVYRRLMMRIAERIARARARAGARDRRRGRPGRVADAREPGRRRRASRRCRSSGRSIGMDKEEITAAGDRARHLSRSRSSRTRTAARCSRRATR